MSADNPNEPSGMKVVELWRRRNAENTKVIWNNSDNNIVAEKLWSERRRGENFETRFGNDKRRIKRHFNNPIGRNAKINT